MRSCPCIDKLACHEYQFAKMCTMNNTVEWSCDKCSTEIYKTCHIWEFSKKKEDYHIFRPCPTNAITYYYPSITHTKCKNCKNTKHSINTGYIWLCQSCHFEQLGVIEMDFPYVSIVPVGNEKNALIPSYGNVYFVSNYKWSILTITLRSRHFLNVIIVVTPIRILEYKIVKRI